MLRRLIDRLFRRHTHDWHTAHSGLERWCCDCGRYEIKTGDGWRYVK